MIDNDYDQYSNTNNAPTNFVVKDVESVTFHQNIIRTNHRWQKQTISAQKNRKYSGIIMYKHIKNTLLIWKKKTHYLNKNKKTLDLISHIYLQTVTAITEKKNTKF